MARLHRDDLARLLDGWLAPTTFTDAAENGLQVEGRAEVERVVCGVTASLELIELAIEARADAVVVHHGLVWSGGIRRLDGWLGARVRRLVKADVNLFAYHLPLDAHPELGNNAQLARALGVVEARPFGRYQGQLIGVAGALQEPLAPGAFLDRVAAKVGPVHPASRLVDVVRTAGICSGGAASMLHEAVAERLDVFVTGEPAEWSHAVSQETGVGFVAAGHHATERFGPRALADKLAAHGLEARFVDVENAA
ncbi:MAG: Nif3-like dinuclear metal center hexameric protein [Deltaproteobacteria bacterium RBG_16_71_12]|nr:MAG: Nif3-like dinuclear metal center hexameric protein [Deltaproteobacteria bacterium RBG_16_71_12]